MARSRSQRQCCPKQPLNPKQHSQRCRIICLPKDRVSYRAVPHASGLTIKSPNCPLPANRVLFLPHQPRIWRKHQPTTKQMQHQDSLSSTEQLSSSPSSMFASTSQTHTIKQEPCRAPPSQLPSISSFKSKSTIAINIAIHSNEHPRISLCRPPRAHVKHPEYHSSVVPGSITASSTFSIFHSSSSPVPPPSLFPNLSSSPIIRDSLHYHLGIILNPRHWTSSPA